MSVAIYYLKLLPAIREAAKLHGYAIGIHGSMERDFDLIAAPWQSIVSPPDVLATAIARAVHGHITDEATDQLADGTCITHPWPRTKPHGRMCWAIQMGGGAYVDLSVLPRKEL